MKVLVVGAREGSLGAAVADSLRNGSVSRAEVVTAGLSDEEFMLDLTSPNVKPDLYSIAHACGSFTHVVCTAGINRTVRIGEDVFRGMMQESFAVNVLGPLVLLEWFLEQEPVVWHDGSRHFVAISSNSAHIARRGSISYCASKAALSMALRVVAREQAHSDRDTIIYGYEPGWINGTPMSESVSGMFASNLHRIPGGQGLRVEDLARIIVSNLEANNPLLNGCMLRLDGGEQ